MFFLFRRLARNADKHQAEALANAMARLGPTYIKLGQFLSTRPDIVGPRAARALESLQDRVPAMPRAQAVKIVERSFDDSIDRIFVSFSDAIAAASVAQVHKARVRAKDGEYDAAVKVLRPGVAQKFKADLSAMSFAAGIAEKYSLEARRLRIREVIETVARSVRLELDFRLEAAAASEFAANTAEDFEFRTPAVDWDRTTNHVLTLEWIEGVPLSDMERLRGMGVDMPELGRRILQSFLRQALRDGLFHADMHQGNLFLDTEGRLAAVDFGIMGRITRAQRKFLAEVLYGFIKKDYYRVALIHFEAGYVPPIHTVEEFAQALRAIGEPIHSRTADQISMGKLLSQLLEVTAIFDMRARPELVLLQKNMMIVEGVARKFDPHLDMWTTAEPIARAWIEDNLGPKGVARDALNRISEFLDVMAKTPRIIDKLEVWVDRTMQEGLTVFPAIKDASSFSRISLVVALPLWLIGVGLILLALK